MFLINGKHLPEGVGFRDANGTQYPSSWLNLSTEEEKLAIGITWVADPIRSDFGGCMVYTLLICFLLQAIY